ncbi:CPBP family intramembrane glutamic endopeptidase [Haloprofundus sp. MHR1]|uniref:CPBP family intramembrane glutamic endopeptidase n=1 Tax=Haloprofundus sp. MHR1 TaxID=2572921 RepID=UPI0010BEC3A4|nr:CPBP family intramembrane glutamic endopeptidase [Haloprofundus sp. MHR1]QCJ47337.1 CPBP family intramembrane metalloprotease [Haloprofundus sp. MHR1]
MSSPPDSAPADDTPPVDSGRGSFLRRALALFALGLLGIAALGVTVATQLGTTPSPPGVDLPLPLLVVASLIPNTLLLLVAVVVGTYCAPRAGFRSHVDERVARGTPVRSNLRPELPTAVVVGLAVGIGIVGLDAVAALFVPEVAQLQRGGGTPSVGALLATVPLRFLYGGIVEELLLRWGFVSLLVYLAWRVLGTGVGPSERVVWAGILVAAVAFGVGHLPALLGTAGSLGIPASAGLVARTVLLNAVGGVAFGWLFWRKSLEAAMVGHAASHVALVGSSLLVILL